jgi:Lactoylglutathione lyase and related lyases
MKFVGTLFVVKDMDASRRFYQDILSRTVLLDLGAYVVFEGFCLLTEGKWMEFLGNQPVALHYGNHVCQLGFEDDDIDAFLAHCRNFPDRQVATPLKEYDWGQRAIRLYDPDGHIIEVGESMKVVVKRFLCAGMTVEETMEKTMYPREFVVMCQKELAE